MRTKNPHFLLNIMDFMKTFRFNILFISKGRNRYGKKND